MCITSFSAYVSSEGYFLFQRRKPRLRELKCLALYYKHCLNLHAILHLVAEDGQTMWPLENPCNPTSLAWVCSIHQQNGDQKFIMLTSKCFTSLTVINSPNINRSQEAGQPQVLTGSSRAEPAWLEGRMAFCVWRLWTGWVLSSCDNRQYTRLSFILCKLVSCMGYQ